MDTGIGGFVAATQSPYVELSRSAWSRLRAHTPLTLSESDISRLAGLGDRVDLQEVEEVYLPLARLLHLHIQAARQFHAVASDFLGELPAPVPYIMGIAGSVAVGKSTTARILRDLLAASPDTPRVELVTTDGFLLSNDQLAARGLLARKGFPESYDRRRLLRFLAQIKAGQSDVRAPVYSHLSYDIVPGEYITVSQPEIVIVEGLNVLQPPRPDSTGRMGLSVSDFFDFSVYVDAKSADVRRWYIERFLRLRATAFANPSSYFHRYAELDDQQAQVVAGQIWADTNEPNLQHNVRPTRGRATLVLTKGPDHAVTRVRLRKP